jgi:hypothetical protein
MAQDARGMQEGRTAQGTEAERQAEAWRRANVFLQGMEHPGGEKSEGGGAGDYGRRSGKKPAHMPSQAEEEATPPE